MLQLTRIPGREGHPRDGRRCRDGDRRGSRGLSAGPSPQAGYALRPFRDADRAALIEIEARAGLLFAGHGYPSIAAAPPLTDDDLARLLEGGSTTVAVDVDEVAVGFAVAAPVAQSWWLRELAVDPRHGRRGVGAALLAAFLDEGKRRGLRMAALSTFLAVPFNAPFYGRHGFRVLAPEAAPRPLAERMLAEVPVGVDPSERVLMVREL